MDLARLRPVSGHPDPEEKIKCKRDAKEMYQTILRYAEKTNAAVPPYDFLELIGKGSYGRVYKCLNKRNGELVAIKLVNIDIHDTNAPISERADSIKALNQEISTMNQLKDKNVKNILLIHEAFDLGPHVWIVSDYCTGGSVKTLTTAMMLVPSAKGLEEKYIIPIARELAIAIKGLHDLGVIHRDIKCGNVYVNEHGDIKLGDFGIVGVLDDNSSKRQTVIGTPHWMPKEIVQAMAVQEGTVDAAQAYGTEVDIWSFGCTLYEMATGHPPHSNKRPEQLALALHNAAPRLEDESFSPGLRDLVAICLEDNPQVRPPISAILDHPYLEDTEESFPTSNLIGLIDKFKMWMHGGGSRNSLWVRSDADAGVESSEDEESTALEGEDDGWNFSTSDSFDQEFGKRYSSIFEFGSDPFAFEAPAGAGLPPLQTQDIPMAERIRREHADLSATRGEQSLGRLFDPSTPSYQLTPEQTPRSSDLPLRTFTGDAPSRESVLEIDLSDVGNGGSATSDFGFNDSTLRPAPRSRTFYDDEDDDDGPKYDEEEDEDDIALGLQDTSARRDTREWSFPKTADPSNRHTMEWTFGSAGQPGLVDVDTLNNFESEPTAMNTARPAFTRTATEPVLYSNGFTFPAQAGLSSAPPQDRDAVTSLLDLDIALADPAELTRPRTAGSATGSTASFMTSGNPFDLEEDPEQNERDRQRFSYHRQLQSDEVATRRKRRCQKPAALHARSQSLSSTDEEHERRVSLSAHFGDASIAQSATDPFHTQTRSASAVHHGTIDPWSGFDSSYPGVHGMPAVHGMQRPEPAYAVLNGLTNGTGALDGSLAHASGMDPSAEREVEFPIIVAPNPEAFIEHADPTLLEEELVRAIDSLSTGMEGLADALGTHFNIDYDDGDGDAEDSELTSDFDSGFDSV